VKPVVLILFFILTLGAARAQDSCGLRITLLTCAPGNELYSIFGHTAIRVQESATGADEVYNYGTFEFGDDFYNRFVRGKLPYFLSVDPFREFLYQYQYESRSVWEQELLLGCARKAELLRALRINALPENRQYRYDFLFDNCTTRSGTMLLRFAAEPKRLTQVITVRTGQAPSFRNHIHEYLDRGGQPWSKLGIDLLLGARLDRAATNGEAMFLPEKLMKGFTGATAAGQLIVSAPKPILELPAPVSGGTLSPLLVFSVLLAVIALLSFVPAKGARTFIAGFDFFLFFSSGLIGILLLFMWFGTDHALCANNWNLAWALPTHALAAFFLRRERRWMHWYLLGTLVLLSALLIGWVFVPQQLNIGFLPVVLLLLLRAWLIILKPHYHGPQDSEPAER